MNTGFPATTRHHLEWLKLAGTESEQLMLQKFFLEELTGLHHLHIMLGHYAFVVWEMMALLQQVKAAASALNPELQGAGRVKELTNKMWLLASSDINLTGQNTDLLAVYRKGMDACGSDSAQINTFIARLRRGEPDNAILRNIGAGSGTISHVQHTRNLLQNGSLHKQIAALCLAPRLPNSRTLLRLIDQLDRKLPVLLMRIRYYFDLELMLQQEIFAPLSHEILSILCADEPEKWAESKQIITETAISRAAVLSDIRAAIKRA